MGGDGAGVEASSLQVLLLTFSDADAAACRLSLGGSGTGDDIPNWNRRPDGCWASYDGCNHGEKSDWGERKLHVWRGVVREKGVDGVGVVGGAG
jgi:hypothetical protein